MNNLFDQILGRNRIEIEYSVPVHYTSWDIYRCRCTSRFYGAWCILLQVHFNHHMKWC